MKAIYKFLIVLLWAFTATAYGEMSWSWTGSYSDLIGMCPIPGSGNCTFTLTGTQSATPGPQVAVSIPGTFTRPTTGFLTMAVTTGSITNTYSSLYDDGTSAGTSSYPASLNTLTGIDIPGQLAVIQPIMHEDRGNPVFFINPNCPDNDATNTNVNYNWAFGHWDPTGGNNTTSSTQFVGGTMTLAADGSGNLTASIPYFYKLNGNTATSGAYQTLDLSASPMPLISNAQSITCSGGVATSNWTTRTGDTTNGSVTISNLAKTSDLAVGMSVTGTGIPANDTISAIIDASSITLTLAATATNTGVSFDFLNGDHSGHLFMGGPLITNATTGKRQGQFLMYKTAARHTVFGVQQHAINNLKNIAGNYAGFIYDTDECYGFGTSTTTGCNSMSSTHAVTVTVTGDNCPSAGASHCYGTVGDATSYVSQHISLVLFGSVDTPATGMFEALVYDGGGSNFGNAYCMLIQNSPPADGAPPYRQGIFCAGQMPGSSTQSTPFNLIATLAPLQTGTQDTTNFGAAGSGAPAGSFGGAISDSSSVVTGTTSSYLFGLTSSSDGQWYYASGTGDFTLTTSQAEVARYNTTTGAIDAAWNTGSVAKPIGAGSGAYRHALQTDGKMVIVGFDNYTTNVAPYHNHAMIARIKTDGTLDAAYASAGKTDLTDATHFPSDFVSASAASYPSTFYTVALDSNGMALAGGYISQTTGWDPVSSANCNSATCSAWLIARFDTTGKIDAGFNSGKAMVHYVPTTTAGSGFVAGIQEEPTTKFIDVVGACGDNVTVGNPNKWGPFNFWRPDQGTGTLGGQICVARLNSDGTFDTNFQGTGSAKITKLAGPVLAFPASAVSGTSGALSNYAPVDIGLDSNGEMVILASTKTLSTHQSPIILKMKTDGTLDTAFGSGTGYMIADPFLVNNPSLYLGVQPSKLIVQGDNKLIVTGWLRSSTLTYGTFALRTLADGSGYDATFSPLQISGTTASGSANVTFGSTSNIIIGAAVSGPGIQSGTVVSSITNGTTIVISKTATASNTTSLTFSSGYNVVGWASTGQVMTGNTHTTATVDGIASTANIGVGMAVSGSGVPAGDYVKTIVSSTSITLNAATTTTVSSDSLTFTQGAMYRPWNYAGILDAAGRLVFGGVSQANTAATKMWFISRFFP